LGYSGRLVRTSCTDKGAVKTLWNPFKAKEKRQTLEEILINGGALTTSVSKAQALNIPALCACVDLIASTIASLPVTLFKELDGKTDIVKEDPRVELLNQDTKDTMDGFQFKYAMVLDYLLTGGGYAYINRSRNLVKSLHFVENSLVAVNKNSDPIFKKYQIQVNGETFREFQFIKLLRKTKDGATGVGVIKENNKLLSLIYNALIYEESLVKTGGNKRGFLKSGSRLSKEAMDELKRGWKELYANDNDNNVLVLNNGLDFQEASQTSVELQLNENKATNSDEICKLFLVSPRVLSGEANDEEYNNWIKTCIIPILGAFEAALNKDLLLPSEKESLFFAFETAELTKGDLEKRFSAYDIAIKGGFMQIDEVRYRENLAPLKLNWLKLGLQDVLYFPESEEIYTPNTNKLAKMGEEPAAEPNSGAIPLPEPQDEPNDEPQNDDEDDENEPNEANTVQN
jgi:HK97 family phage portal protein